MRLVHLALGLAVAVSLLGCSRDPASLPQPRSRQTGVTGTPAGKGTRLAEGFVQDLRVTSDGKHSAYLQDVKKPRVEGVPAQAVTGDLYVVAVGGGPARKLGTGVTNLPGGYLFTPDSAFLLYRTAYDVTRQAGQLEAVSLESAGAAPRVLGKLVTGLAVSASGKHLAWIEGGVLKRTTLPDGPVTEVSGEVAVADFSSDGTRLFFRRTLTAGGGFFVAALEGDKPPTKIAEKVGDFRLPAKGAQIAFAQRSEASPDSYDLYVATAPTFASQRVGLAIGSFAFSPDGKYLARTEGQRPELLGDLLVGPAEGGPGRKVGERVQDFTFAPDGTALAFGEKYDVRSRTAQMAVVALPDGKTKKLGAGMQNYEWGTNGKHIAYLAQFLKPVFSVDLMVYPVGAEQPTKVAQGVFGYGFAPGNAYLLLRTRCTREGRACELSRVDLTNLAQPPQLLVEGIYSFRPSADASRVLVSYARLDSDTFDLAAYDVKTKGLDVLDRAVLLPGFWAGTGADRIVYAVVDRARAGVYTAPVAPGSAPAPGGK